MAAIRQAGIAEFSEKGLNGTSTQAFAQRAGLPKPQLHYCITNPGQVLGDYIRSRALDKPDVSRIFTHEVLDGGRNLAKFWADLRRPGRPCHLP